jgi:hypothetical protein
MHCPGKDQRQGNLAPTKFQSIRISFHWNPWKSDLLSVVQRHHDSHSGHRDARTVSGFGQTVTRLNVPQQYAGVAEQNIEFSGRTIGSIDPLNEIDLVTLG